MLLNRILLTTFTLILLASTQTTTPTPTTDITISPNTVTSAPVLAQNTKGPTRTSEPGAKVVRDTEAVEATSGRWKKDFDDPLVTMSGWLALEAGLYNYYTRRSVLRQWGLFLAVGFAGLRLVPDEWHWLWAKVVPGLFAVVVIGPRVIL